MPRTIYTPNQIRGITGPYNIFNYGAVADRSKSISLAVQLAMNAAANSQSGQGAVYIPGGTYIMSSFVQWLFSQVPIYGDGIDVTRIIATNTISFPNGLFKGARGLIGNHMRDMTIDCNGSNGAIFTGGSSVITACDLSTYKNIKLCNRLGTVNSGATISGTTGLLIPGRGVLCDHFEVRDDFVFQTVTSGAITGTLGTGQSNTIVVANIANFIFNNAPGNQTIIIDPAVASITNVPLTATVPTVITPTTDDDNLYPGAGPTTGMLGIYNGLTVVIDTVASGAQESCVVSNCTNSSFQITPANNHASGVPITYAGKTEYAQILGVNAGASQITFKAQNSYASGVGIIGFGSAYDGIAATGQASGQNYCQDINIINGIGKRLAEDYCGAAVARKVKFINNEIYGCPSGYCMTDVSDYGIHENIADASFNQTLPILPVDLTASPNQIWSGVCDVTGTPTAGAAVQSTYNRHGITSNKIRGYGYGILKSGVSSLFEIDVVENDNNISDSLVNSVYISGQKSVVAKGNTYRNANRLQQANQSGLDVGHVLILGASAATASDGINLSDNNYYDDTGHANRTQAAVVASGANVTNVVVNGGIMSGVGGGNSKGIQTNAVPTGNLQVLGLKGYNGLGTALTGTPTTSPASGTKYQNNTGSPMIVKITGGTVSDISIYDTAGNNGMSLASATGFSFVLPPNQQYSVTWTVQPTAAFSGQ